MIRFATFILTVDGMAEATIDDLVLANLSGPQGFSPDGQKYFYVIETEIIDDRFYWFTCDYDNASRFSAYVVDAQTMETQPNPRNKNQVEPRYQFFACYDAYRKRLYISDRNKCSTFRKYVSEKTQKNYRTDYIYTSVEEFCSRVKTIKGFKFVQVDNIFCRDNDIFKAVASYSGLDMPRKLQLKVTYDDVPVHVGRGLIDRIHRDKNAFESVMIIGADEDGIEQVFDFTSIIESVTIDPVADENEQYNKEEVKSLLIAQLR